VGEAERSLINRQRVVHLTLALIKLFQLPSYTVKSVRCFGNGQSPLNSAPSDISLYPARLGLELGVGLAGLGLGLVGLVLGLGLWSGLGGTCPGRKISREMSDTPLFRRPKVH